MLRNLETVPNPIEFYANHQQEIKTLIDVGTYLGSISLPIIGYFRPAYMSNERARKISLVMIAAQIASAVLDKAIAVGANREREQTAEQRDRDTQAIERIAAENTELKRQLGRYERESFNQAAIMRQLTSQNPNETTGAASTEETRPTPLYNPVIPRRSPLPAPARLVLPHDGIPPNNALSTSPTHQFRRN